MDTENWLDREQPRYVDLLKAEIRRKGLTYGQLAKLIDDKEASIKNKLYRGKFTAAFLLRCLAALGVKELKL